MAGDLFGKKVADLTVLEMLELNYMVSVANKPTLSKEEFRKMLNMHHSRLKSLLENRLLPNDMIVDGYEGRAQRKPIMFITEKVIDWLKERTVPQVNTAESFYRNNFK